MTGTINVFFVVKYSKIQDSKMFILPDTEMTKKLETTNEMNVDDAVIASAPLYRYLHCLIIYRPQRAYLVFTWTQEEFV